MTTKKKIIRRRTVSLATLEYLGACHGQYRLFRSVFNVERLDKVAITTENVLKAWQNMILIDWLVYKVVSKQRAAAWRRMHRNIANHFYRNEITNEEKLQQQAQLLVTLLTEHWGEK